MSESNMNLRITEERGDRLRRVMQATGENTKAKALDIAMNHYLADLENKKRVAGDLPGDLADDLATPWLPIERETRVGRTD
jgi:hypothetical protein